LVSCTVKITPREIVDVCRRYKPEQLVLYRARAGGEWAEFLNAAYQPAFEDTNCVLYVSKGILAVDASVAPQASAGAIGPVPGKSVRAGDIRR
jgi:hypothetical protein